MNAMGRWIPAFIGASALVVVTQPTYIEYGLGRFSIMLLDLLHDAGRNITGSLDGVKLLWTAADGAHGKVGLRLASYNFALYLTAIFAISEVKASTRLRWLRSGLPLLFLWQIGDVLLTVESQWLTVMRPQAYDIGSSLDLWFLGVKFANNFNVLAGRQLIPFAIIGAQWWHWHAEAQVREGYPEDLSS